MLSDCLGRPIRHYFSTAFAIAGPDPEAAVQTLVSTNNVHPRDRFDCWHSVASKNLVDHDSRPECRETFQAELKGGTLGDLGLVVFENSPMDISDTRATTAQLFVCHQMAGKIALEQNGGGVVLEGGDITLIDPLAPYAGSFSRVRSCSF